MGKNACTREEYLTGKTICLRHLKNVYASFMLCTRCRKCYVPNAAKLNWKMPFMLVMSRDIVAWLWTATDIVLLSHDMPPSHPFRLHQCSLGEKCYHFNLIMSPFSVFFIFFISFNLVSFFWSAFRAHTCRLDTPKTYFAWKRIQSENERNETQLLCRFHSLASRITISCYCRTYSLFIWKTMKLNVTNTQIYTRRRSHM